MADWPRESWLDAEPARARRERDDMQRLAPEMIWVDGPAGGWEGLAPSWPFPRAEPPGLDVVLDGHRLQLRIQYSQGFPMVEPKLYPLEPSPPPDRRILHSWHLMGDGGLCLLQTADLWTGRDSAADLVVKASGWFIEYRLMERGLIEQMTETGIYSDVALDSLIEKLVR